MSSLSDLRIVQVVPVLVVGGLERMATTLALALAPRVEREVVCSAGGKTFGLRLQAAGIPISRIPRPTSSPLRLLRAALALAGVLRRERPQVVHAHNPAATIAAGIARVLARSGAAIVATYYGVPGSQVPQAVRAFKLFADEVVGIGPSATRELVTAGLPEDRIRTIYYAVEARAERTRDEVRAELGLSADDEVVVTVGRYSSEKNQALLLDALARLRERRPRVRAVLVGVGPLEEDLRQRARALGLADRVELTGARPDAADIVGASDVFAFPSTREALGLAALEAMAAGTPVVATAVGGIPDIVSDGENGLLVPSGDADALARAIERILGDGELRARLVDAGREFVDRSFSTERMVAEYAAAYSAALARRRARR